MDKIEAVVIALACLSGNEDTNRLRARARASMVERALDLAGYVIVPKASHNPDPPADIGGTVGRNV